AYANVQQLLVGQRGTVGRFQRCRIGGGCIDHSVSRSSALATRRSVAASNRRPVSRRPIGSRSAVKPHGTLTAGSPARLALTVNTSARYICSGSETRSPIRNAGVGLVGIAITSTAPLPEN